MHLCAKLCHWGPLSLQAVHGMADALAHEQRAPEGPFAATSPRTLPIALWSIAHAACYHGPLAAAAAKSAAAGRAAIVPLLAQAYANTQIGPYEAAVSVYACGQMGLRDPVLMAELARVLERAHPAELHPQNYANMLYACAKLASRGQQVGQAQVHVRWRRRQGAGSPVRGWWRGLGVRLNVAGKGTPLLRVRVRPHVCMRVNVRV